MTTGELRIGEVASLSGVSIDTVRYYERLRLLPAAPRTKGGFRCFTSDTVTRVQFIKQAQELGLSLEEIKELMVTDGMRECRKVRDLLRVKLDEVRERIRLMEDFQMTLADHLATCERNIAEQGEEAECPVLVHITHGTTLLESK